MIHLAFFLLFGAPADIPAMKAEVRALAKPKCATAAQCRAVPLGSAPCGGPTEFVVTCASAPDFKALEAKAKAASDAQRVQNEKNQRMSVCTALSPPALTLEGGACTAVPAKPTDVPM